MTIGFNFTYRIDGANIGTSGGRVSNVSAHLQVKCDIDLRISNQGIQTVTIHTPDVLAERIISCSENIMYMVQIYFQVDFSNSVVDVRYEYVIMLYVVCVWCQQVRTDPVTVLVGFPKFTHKSKKKHVVTGQGARLVTVPAALLIHFWLGTFQESTFLEANASKGMHNLCIEKSPDLQLSIHPR